MSLKVITFNIHKGYGPFKKNYEMKTIRKILKKIKADVILLQEIHGHHPSSYDSQHSPLEELADQHWPHFRHGVNSIYPSNFHGNAILSRFPIAEWVNTDISTNRMEKRGFLYAKVQHSNGQNVDLFCTHLNLFPTGQYQQFKKMNHLIKKYNHSPYCLLGGDFNDWGYLSRRFLKSQFEHVKFYRTYPSYRPVLSLDRLYYKGFKLQNSRISTDFKEGSDHLPIIADFEF